jgi:hypothetical protein
METSMTWNQMRLNVSGSIVFKSSVGIQLDTKLLLATLLQVYELYPWDSNGETKIGWCSEIRETKQADETYAYVIEIRPPYALSSGQLNAYYNHVTLLAEKITALNLEGMDSVMSSINISSTCNTFRTASADMRWRKFMLEEHKQIIPPDSTPNLKLKSHPSTSESSSQGLHTCEGLFFCKFINNLPCMTQLTLHN